MTIKTVLKAIHQRAESQFRINGHSIKDIGAATGFSKLDGVFDVEECTPSLEYDLLRRHIMSDVVDHRV